MPALGRFLLVPSPRLALVDAVDSRPTHAVLAGEACALFTIGKATLDLVNLRLCQLGRVGALTAFALAVPALIVAVILRSRAPRKVDEPVVLRAAGTVQSLHAGRARADERLKDHAIHVPGVPALSVGQDYEAVVASRMPAPGQNASGYAPWMQDSEPVDHDHVIEAADAAEVADLVQALPSDHRQPSFGRLGFREGQFRRNVKHASLLYRLAVPRPVSAGAGLSNALCILP